MNIVKLIAPDFLLGKILVSGKALLDILGLLARNPSKRSLRLARLVLQVVPKYTMVSTSRLINLYNLVEEADRLNLPGDIVECGVWNGGSAAIMALACRDDKACRAERVLWLFDSFQGLPRPGERDGKLERDNYFEGWNRGDTEKVRQVFDKFNIPLENVKIIPGWFDETLKTASINRISVLHIDADWYDSVKVVLKTLYDKVVQGGFIILDDYDRWPGCKEAVADYFKEHGIERVIIKKVDRSGAYFQKHNQIEDKTEINVRT